MVGFERQQTRVARPGADEINLACFRDRCLEMMMPSQSESHRLVAMGNTNNVFLNKQVFCCRGQKRRRLGYARSADALANDLRRSGDSRYVRQLVGVIKNGLPAMFFGQF